ncbi:hypothetical protein [Streptomyces sp. NPDC060035]
MPPLTWLWTNQISATSAASGPAQGLRPLRDPDEVDPDDEDEDEG